jgi:hypothetical protein
MSNIICSWTTYKGSHCKKIVNIINDKQSICFCSLHRELILNYSRVNEQEELCDTSKEIKIIPRSYKHLKFVMSSINNEDDTIQVYMAGGCIEEADITNIDYISLNSDNSKFYYNPKRGQNRAKDLKVILREFCKNNCIVEFGNLKYCEECYKKLKYDVPRISLIHRDE